jgi:hypothetical protein
MTNTAEQARAGQQTVIIDSDDDTNEEGKTSRGDTTDHATSHHVASETSDAEGVDNSINSDDELGEQAHFLYLQSKYEYSACRETQKGLDCTGLCLLSAGP